MDLIQKSCLPVWPNVLAFSLVVTSLRLELYPSAGHDSGSQAVAVKLLLLAETISMMQIIFLIDCESGFLPEAQNIEGILSVLQFFIVID